MHPQGVIASDGYGMKQSAIATGMIDLVLPQAEIPEAVMCFATTRPRVPEVDDGDRLEQDNLRLLPKIFATCAYGTRFDAVSTLHHVAANPAWPAATRDHARDAA